MALKKTFPKIKKSFEKFLTDESGKITKKDALGISAGAAFLAAADNTLADHGIPSAVYHQNNVVTIPDPDYPNVPFPSGTYTENFEVEYSTTDQCQLTPLNNSTINGHFSGANAAGADPWAILHIQWHGSHASHGSHGSHGSRW